MNPKAQSLTRFRGSDQSRGAETIVADVGWVVRFGANNHMIHQIDADGLGGIAQLSGHLDIS
jgi:hypothetical protein